MSIISISTVVVRSLALGLCRVAVPQLTRVPVESATDGERLTGISNERKS
jgi:hypothetical protein